MTYFTKSVNYDYNIVVFCIIDWAPTGGEVYNKVDSY